MSNPFYTYSGSFIPGTLGRAEAVASEFNAVQSGFALLATQGVDTGSANAYVITTQGAPTAAYADGSTVTFKATHANTGPSVISVNAIGNASLLRFSGAALAAGDISLNTWYTVTYNSSFSAWCISGPAAVVTTVGTIALGAPTHLVGLVSAGGSSTQVAPIDATYAIDQSIAPTWSGSHNFTGGLKVNGTSVSTSVGANPTATIGLSAVNGSASTWMRSDAAPALSQSISPTWTGNHVYTPSSGVGLAINGVSGNNSLTVNSGTGASTAVNDILISRAGSTANARNQGPGLSLYDSTNSTESVFQQSGGQTELWQFNGSWNQIWYVNTSRGLVLNAPGSGSALAVTGVASASAAVVTITAPNSSGNSRGLSVEAGSTSGDINAAFYGASGANNYLVIYGDGGVIVGAPTGGTQGLGTLNIGNGLYINGSPVYAGVPQHAISGAYTMVASDANKHLYQQSAGTVTIPANSSVAFPVGTLITVVNYSGSAISIAINSDTLSWSPTGASGTRTLANFGQATMLKLSSTGWLISGPGLS